MSIPKVQKGYNPNPLVDKVRESFKNDNTSDLFMKFEGGSQDGDNGYGNQEGYGN
jgi:hypothetical protein